MAKRVQFPDEIYFFSSVRRFCCFLRVKKEAKGRFQRFIRDPKEPLKSPLRQPIHLRTKPPFYESYRRLNNIELELIWMNLYMTAGTYDFLERLAEKHSGENMVLMTGEDGALLVHETEGKTVFASPRKYEVLESVGELGNPGMVVMNNIPATDEGKPVFEYRFKNRAGKIEASPRFQAIRVLTPIKSNTYVILTAWEDEAAFESWKNSNSFGKSHGAPKEESGPSIFSGKSYITKYYISE